MAIFLPGDQKVGIERDVAVLDADGDPVLSEFGEPQTTAEILWVHRALFEVPRFPFEQQDLAVTLRETAWAILPIGGDSVIPAVDDSGGSAPLPFFDDTGQVAITSSAWLIHDGLRYAMRGEAVLERDIRGRPDHVFCHCERQRI